MILEKFPFLICPNALPKAAFPEFVEAVSETCVRNIGIRAAWQSFAPGAAGELQICDISVSGNFAEAAKREQLFEAMEIAQKFYIPQVSIASSPQLSVAEQRSSIAFFRDAAACAGEKGLRFTLETYGVISRTANECLRVLAEVDHPALEICYDTANVWRFAPEFKTAADLFEDFCKLKGHIGYMHLKDFDPETQKIMVLGEGKIDFPAIFAKLAEWKFDGFIGLDLETSYAREINTLEAHKEALQLSLKNLSTIVC